MGNGVDRLVSCEPMPIAALETEARLLGREPMIYPYPDRFFALWKADAESRGIENCDALAGSPFLRSFSRSIDEDTIEILCWHAC